MSMSFFDAAMILMQPHNVRQDWRVQEFNKKILVEYLSAPENIVKLKNFLYGKRLDGNQWFGDDNKVILEEYISSLPKKQLNQLFQAVKIKKTEGINYFSPTVLQFFRILTPTINFISTIFNNNEDGFLALLSNWMHNMQVSKKPELDLTFREKSRSMQYSRIFIDAAKDNKRYNQLYREIIKTAHTEEQILSGLLNYLKSLTQQKFLIEAQCMLLKIEKVLFKGQELASDGVAEEVCLSVQRNLLIASNLMQARCKDVDIDSTTEKLKLFKLNNAVNIFRNLLNDVIKKEKQLEHDPLTKAQRDKLVEFVIDNKRKLLSFVLQSQAFSKEETLNTSVGWLGDPYVDVSGNRHDTYFDFWLTKVPAGREKAKIIDNNRTHLYAANNIQHLDLKSVHEIDNKFVVLPWGEKDNPRMILKQFKPVPFNVADCKKGDEVHQKEAYQESNLTQSTEKELIMSCDIVFALRELIVQIDKDVGSVDNKDFDSQNALARSKALSDMYLLQKTIVQNIVNITKVNLEITKQKQSALSILNWEISQEDQKVIWQQVQRYLNVYDANDARYRFVKEAFNACLLQGGLSVQLQDQLEFAKDHHQTNTAAVLFQKINTSLIDLNNQLQNQALEIKKRHFVATERVSNKDNQECLALHL